MLMTFTSQTVRLDEIHVNANFIACESIGRGFILVLSLIDFTRIPERCFMEPMVAL